MRIAELPFQLPADMPPEQVDNIRQNVDQLASSSQYGWGHNIDFGQFKKEGLLGDDYLEIAGALDAWDWWPKDLAGQAVADVGCFTGGLSLYLAARNPSVVYAIDELPEHLAQCAYLADLFQVECISPIESSVFFLSEHLAEDSLDLVLLSGVLYHLSDMLVGLYAMRCLLKPGGTLLVESNAVDDFEQSYANFGRFFAGMWWQPSGLCIQDMCEFMGFEDTQIRFYKEGRCLVRSKRSDRDIPFKRGLHWRFAALEDARIRTMNPGTMKPVQATPGMQRPERS